MRPRLRSLIKAVTSHAKGILFGRQPGVYEVLIGVGRGLRLYIDPICNTQRILGLAEIEVSREFRDEVRGVGRYIELGASDGYYCALARRENPTVDIVAFEPREHFHAIAIRNLEQNGLGLDRFSWKIELGGVPSRPLGDLIDVSIVTFIKIDIDGGEAEALITGGKKWAAFKGGLLIEVHSQHLKDDCLKFLQSEGFSCRVIRQAWWRKILPEQRPLELNEWISATKGQAAIP